MSMRTTLSALTAVLWLAPMSAGAAPGVPEKIEFNRDIRPLLAERCFACHGPDANQREGSLRLDTREGALAEADSAIAVVPGKPDESSLIERIETDDEELRMPPSDAGKPLTAQERLIGLLYATRFRCSASRTQPPRRSLRSGSAASATASAASCRR